MSYSLLIVEASLWGKRRGDAPKCHGLWYLCDLVFVQKTWGSFLLGSYSPTYALLLNDSVWETSPEAFSFWQQTIPDCLRSPCPFLNFFLHRVSLSPFISPTVHHLVPFTSSLLPLLIKSNSEKWYFTTSLTLNAFFFLCLFSPPFNLCYHSRSCVILGELQWRILGCWHCLEHRLKDVW